MGDGRQLPATQPGLLDAKDLSLVKVIPTLDAAGARTSRVSAVYDAAPRKSFIAALKDVPEVWEISYDPDAEPVAEGLVHDYQYREGHFKPGMFTPAANPAPGPSRRLLLHPELPRDPRRRRARLPRGRSSSSTDARRSPTSTCPGCRIWAPESPGSGQDPAGRERTVMASPNLNEGLVTVIDLDSYQNVKQIRTLGPGFFMRSHENSATPSPIR
jgi:hypothetical protein